jgi:hypothetical protein
MKTSTSGTRDERLRITAAELEESIVMLFTERPELCGFTIRQEGLVLSDVGLWPLPGPEELKLVCEEIHETLLELVEVRPEARQLLAGRTFARALH